VPYVQILCNDAKEREHLQHVLLANRHILCYESDKKRFFGKWAQEEEKAEFK